LIADIAAAFAAAFVFLSILPPPLALRASRRIDFASGAAASFYAARFSLLIFMFSLFSRRHAASFSHTLFADYYFIDRIFFFASVFTPLDAADITPADDITLFRFHGGDALPLIRRHCRQPPGCHTIAIFDFRDR
jgi:hypothetical protein